MAKHRFFVEPLEFNKEEIGIKGDDLKHLKKVLRLGTGDRIEILDGLGKAAEAQIVRFENEIAFCKPLDIFTPKGKPPLKITLLQGLAKGEKMELIIQKTTELGISRIIPVACQRSVVRLDKNKALNKKERWQKVALEASKQCRRPDIPKVDSPLDFKEALNLIPKEALFLLLWEKEQKKSFEDILKKSPPYEIFLAIGPEGGFEEEEVKMALLKGAFSLSLGSRILRTETASLACLAILMQNWGDI